VPTEVCGILAPKLEAALAAFSRGFAAGKLPDNIRAIECFTDFSGEHLLVNVALSQKGLAAPVFAEKLREIAPNIESILFQDEQSESFDLSGPGYIQYEAAGHRYRVGHLSFFQVNRLILDDLVRAVAGEKPFTGAKGGLALDLYAGVGLFSIPLADHYERVIAVEGNVATARDLESNLKEHPASRARHADTETFLSRMKETPELIVLDPPRAGVPVPALQRIREIAPPQITYLSCDPATLARDLAFLTGSAAAGARYQISDITLYDIFPQTYHIEALVKLQRLG
jgi:23S rRNA (uracil1939-C5)-methyltransferase